jgi:exodeoxyribonuclease V alpha subunit
MHRGAAGVTALNARLREALNPGAPHLAEVHAAGRTFRLGDKVMQIRNNYDKDVFNGDLGRVAAIDSEEQWLTVTFDGTPAVYDYSELDELALAFACSTHKSQGAEYPAVVLALLPAHYLMLQRNLLYTGITRARQLCVIVGSLRAIGLAVANDRVAARHTLLGYRLRQAAGAD